MVLGFGAGFPRGPWSKRAPGGFGVWGGVLQEVPGQKGPLVVLGFGAVSSKEPLVKKGPWWFWGLGRVSPKRLGTRARSPQKSGD